MGRRTNSTRLWLAACLCVAAAATHMVAARPFGPAGSARSLLQGGQCGPNAGGASCIDGQCCSQYGWCGDTDAHCGAGCQSAYGSCSGGGGGGTPSSGGSSGGSTYSGDITWYNDVGTTACGENVPGDGDYAAISWPLSDQLNTNANWPPSWCGRNAQVTGPTGLTAIVRVIDKCQACQYGDIDVTPSIFNQVVPGGTDVGRASVTWQFV